MRRRRLSWVGLFVAVVLSGWMPASARGDGPPASPPPAPRVHGQPVGPAAEAPPEPPAATEPGQQGPGDLFPNVPMARAAGWILEPEPAPSSREERAEQALEEYFDRELTEDRLSSVGASPWYYEMQRSMRRAFRPDMGDARDDYTAGMNPAGRAVYELGRYAHPPERPQDPRGTPPVEMRGHLSREEQALSEWMDQTNLLNAPVTWHRVDVRVTQNPEGVVSAVWVIRSSGSPTIDRAAMAAVRDGSVELPAPPANVVGDRDAIQTDWSFEAGDVATYANQAGCVDDPVHGMQCAAFGRGIVRTRIRLLRVHDALNPSLSERRAAQHRLTRRIRP